MDKQKGNLKIGTYYYNCDYIDLDILINIIGALADVSKNDTSNAEPLAKKIEDYITRGELVPRLN